MTTKKPTSKDKYARQFTRTRTNKIRRIEKELARNPNNKVAKETLEKLRREK